MTYQELTKIQVECEHGIHALMDAKKSAEEIYTLEHFDSRLFGYLVRINNKFYPRTAHAGCYVITKAKVHCENRFDLTIVPANEHGEAIGHSYEICGISMDEIEIVETK